MKRTLLTTSLILVTATIIGFAQDKPAASTTSNTAAAVRAFIDDEAPGWRSLTAADFTKVNSADDTWSWKDGVLHCTGQPVSVQRTTKEFGNFEMVVEWMHEKAAGNSGVFVWTTPASIEKLTAAGKPGLPDGIEVPARATVTLAPGGLHLMFMQLKEPLVEGTKVPVTLTFEKAGTVEIELDVGGIAAKEPATDHSMHSDHGGDAQQGSSM